MLSLDDQRLARTVEMDTMVPVEESINVAVEDLNKVGLEAKVAEETSTKTVDVAEPHADEEPVKPPHDRLLDRSTNRSRRPPLTFIPIFDSVPYLVARGLRAITRPRTPCILPT